MQFQQALHHLTLLILPCLPFQLRYHIRGAKGTEGPRGSGLLKPILPQQKPLFQLLRTHSPGCIFILSPINTYFFMPQHCLLAQMIHFSSSTEISPKCYLTKSQPKKKCIFLLWRKPVPLPTKKISRQAGSMCLCKSGLDSVLFSSHYSFLHNLSKALQTVKGQWLPGLLFLLLSYGVLCLPFFSYVNPSWMTHLWKDFANRDLSFFFFFFCQLQPLQDPFAETPPFPTPRSASDLSYFHTPEYSLATLCFLPLIAPFLPLKTEKIFKNRDFWRFLVVQLDVSPEHQGGLSHIAPSHTAQRIFDSETHNPKRLGASSPQVRSL